MEKTERQKVIADLRKHHEDILPTGAYFSAKFPHIPEGMEGKHIGLYPSECSKGDNVFIECVNMSYEPLDGSRRLYVWNHNRHYADAYKTKKEQFLIPVSELHVVPPIHDNRIGAEDTYSEAPKTYIKTESVQVTYTEETFVSVSGARAKLVRREGELFEYTYHEEKGKEPCTKLTGIELRDTYEFFKQLKK